MKKIVISNDDGYGAPGIVLLTKLLRELCPNDSVTVSAPAADCSGNASKLAYFSPIKVKKMEEKGYSIFGAPAESMSIGIEQLSGGNPDIIFSGINNGSNIGDCLAYSGTAAAAFEGGIRSISSVSFSQCREASGHCTFNENKVKDLIKVSLSASWEKSVTMNINVGKDTGSKQVFIGLSDLRFDGDDIRLLGHIDGLDYYVINPKAPSQVSKKLVSLLLEGHTIINPTFANISLVECGKYQESIQGFIDALVAYGYQVNKISDVL